MGNENDEVSLRRVTSRLQWKRFWILALCYFSCYTAFRGLRDLQSTLNNAEGMGLASLSLLNAFSAVAGLLVPAVIRLKLGTKWSVVLGIFLHILYIASNYYENAYLLLSAAVFPGIGAAFMWVSRGTYITTVAMELAAANQRNPAADTALLNSIFYGVSRMSTLSSNIISSLVFQKGWQFLESNQTANLASCGKHACGGDTTANTTGALVPPDQASRNLLVSIYLGLGVFSLVIAVAFLERVPPKAAPVINEEVTVVTLTTKEVFYSMMSAFRLMRRPRMLLLIPGLFFLGADMAFVSAHFTKFFVGCTQGIEAVGFIAVPLYIIGALGSPVMGRLIKYTGRAPVFFAGCAVYLALLIVMLVWAPESGKLWHLCVMASGLGFTRAAIPTVISTLLGLLFPDQKEAAFGNLCFWQSLGFAAISFIGVPQAICAVHVITVTIVVLVTVMALYGVLEFRVKGDKQRPRGQDEDNTAGSDSGSVKEENLGRQGSLSKIVNENHAFESQSNI
ncbi:protein unc-93 homolog A-like [Patiria miniata]|uniref:Uncharacterized protein n=1 Tax=Patiria miniata TaxID=46514 RepID=A0A914A1P5_PATMI|nr:protein unc-93 homolog A-like [Patiria miniata]